MRQIVITISEDNAIRIEEVAQQHAGVKMAKIKGEEGLTYIYIFENNALGTFLSEVQSLEKIKVSFYPQGVIHFKGPLKETGKQVKNVKEKSPVEIFVSGWQSVGSWKSFIGYSFIAGVITWVGLYTNTIFLLIGGMLIAPYAGAALTSSIGSAAGDLRLLKEGVLRYFIALAIGFAVSLLLTLSFRIGAYSSLMSEISQVPSIALFLPVMAGLAGAIGLVNPERNSLISGAAFGLLISASLAPQTSMLGIAVATGKINGIKSASFILLLQLIGIHLASSLVFRLYGSVSPRRIPLVNGTPKAFISSVALALALGAGMIYWQFSTKPDLQEATIQTQIHTIIKDAAEELPQVDLAEANVSFTETKEKTINPVLCEIYIIKVAAYYNPYAYTEYTDKLIQLRLKERIKEKIKEKNLNVTPIFKIDFVSS